MTRDQRIALQTITGRTLTPGECALIDWHFGDRMDAMRVWSDCREHNALIRYLTPDWPPIGPGSPTDALYRRGLGW